jgi:acylphosphatase
MAFGGEAMEVAYKVRISGRVTGVGFRYSMINKANAFPELKGYVRNVGYGEVEALLQGKPEDIDQMLIWMRKGPPLARVDDMQVNEVPVSSGLGCFGIR